MRIARRPGLTNAGAVVIVIFILAAAYIYLVSTGAVAPPALNEQGQHTSTVIGGQSLPSAIAFKDESDAVFQGNNTEYGLSAAVWTRDVGRAHKVARALKAGTVWVNCYNQLDPISPFGGYKQSGFGRELGRYAIDLYTQIKSVWMKL